MPQNGTCAKMQRITAPAHLTCNFALATSRRNQPRQLCAAAGHVPDTVHFVRSMCSAAPCIGWIRARVVLCLTLRMWGHSPAMCMMNHQTSARRLPPARVTNAVCVTPHPSSIDDHPPVILS